ncbi:MAG: MFS transporter [Spirochaetaceae bacterium]|nr:MAG: MFS transporter [Spirochaetaceae bacterium]
MSISSSTDSVPRPSLRRVVTVLMAPTLMSIMTMSMFAVAVPVIRLEYALTADVTSWLLVAYTLPFMMFMPLYGRLGDGLGKRRLLLFGIVLFIAGTTMLLFVRSLPLMLLARAVQGIGAAGVNPLAMAIIVQFAPPEQQGKALGTWNSIGPAAAIAGPLIAGAMIDALGWRSILIPALLVGFCTLVFTARFLPPGTRAVRPRTVIRGFDWGGVALFNGAVALLVFFTSSRPITGVPPLRDLRLLAAGLLLLAGFVLRVRRRQNPFIELSIFRNRNFSLASVCVSIRMLLMGGAHFVLPLFVTDLYGLPSAATGSLLMLHSGALLTTMWLGGILIDRWRSRMQIVVGLGIESLAMLLFLLLPDGAPLHRVFAILGLHGLGAGLCLAALHLYAMGAVSRERSATAAGLYSMVRFGGSMLGAAIGGVVLYAGLETHGMTAAGYRPAFLFYLVVSVIGALSAMGLTKRMPRPVE